MRLRKSALLPAGILVSAVGLVLEGLAAWWWLAAVAAAQGFVPVLIVLLHFLAALLLAAGTWLLLPLRYRTTRNSPLIYFFAVNFFVPVLGALGTLLGLLPSLYRFRPQAEGTWEVRVEPDLPFKPVEINPNSIFRRTGLAAVVKYLDDQKLRRRVVMATRHLSGHRAVPILRDALADSSDEVRLLAYSMLSGKERSFEIEIQRLQRELGLRENGRRDWLEEQIASLYWEQAVLGLVEGEVQAYVLRQAIQHIDSALVVRVTAPRRLLRGKICLRLMRLDDAKKSFEEARLLGMGDNFLSPHWAELAFKQRDFDTLRAELARLSRQTRALPRLMPVVNYWL